MFFYLVVLILLSGLLIWRLFLLRKALEAFSNDMQRISTKIQLEISQCNKVVRELKKQSEETTP